MKNKNVEIAMQKLVRFLDYHEDEVDTSLISEAIYFLAQSEEP